MRSALYVFCTFVVVAQASGQDMALSQVLAPGEAWQKLGGVADAVALAGDGQGTLFAAEGKSGRILAIAGDGKVTVLATLPGASSLAVSSTGTLFVGQAALRSITRIDSAGHPGVFAKNVPSRAIAAVSDQRLYVSSGEEKAVSQIDAPGGNLRKRIIPENASCLTLWNPPGTLVAGDSAGKHLWAFRIEADGALTAGEPYYALRTTPGQSGGASGLTIDAAGRLFAATRAGIQVFDPTGRLSGVILSPTGEAVTAVAFGGAAGDRLFAVSGGIVYYRRTLTHGANVVPKKP